MEAPIRRTSQQDKRLLGFGVACIVMTLAVAFMLTKYTPELTGVQAEAQRFYEAKVDFNPYRRRCHSTADNVIPYKNRCRFGDNAEPSQIAVWADSHGSEIAAALGEAAGANGLSVAQITSSGCPPAPGVHYPKLAYCEPHNTAMLAAMVADADLKTVVVISRYEGTPDSLQPALERSLGVSIEKLVTAGKEVVLMDPIPEYDYPVPEALAARVKRGWSLETYRQSLADYQRRQAHALAMLDRLSRAPGVRRLKTGEALCPNDRCDIVLAGRSMYSDDNHLSMVGARELVKRSTAVLLPETRH